MLEIPRARLALIALAVFTASIAVLAAAPLTAAPAAEGPAQPRWHDDLQAAIEEARERDCLVLTYLKATWCAACKKQSADVLPSAGFLTGTRDYVLLALDIEDQGSGTLLDRRFNRERKLPLTLLLDDDLIAQASHAGYAPAPRLLASLKGQTKRTRKLLERYEALEGDEKPAALGKMVDELLARGDGERAATLLRQLLEGAPPEALETIRRRLQLAQALYFSRDLVGALDILDETARHEAVAQQRSWIRLQVAMDFSECGELLGAIEEFLSANPKHPYSEQLRVQRPGLRAQCGGEATFTSG